MVSTKRGLGRGLEALLVEVPVISETSLHSYDMEQLYSDPSNPLVVADLQQPLDLPASRHTVRHVLLKEAESLMDFLNDVETMIQRYGV